jgi:hypothetical protein
MANQTNDSKNKKDKKPDQTQSKELQVKKG